MSYATERTAIYTRWAEQWVTGSPSAARTVTQYENVPFTVPTSGAWARITIRNGDAAQISAGDPGNNTHRHPGVLFIQVFVKEGTGTATLREHADAAAAIFRNTRIGTIFCRVPSVSIPDPDGGWQSATITVPFYRDEDL